jgi:outer membrane protein assembly factor BamB
MKHFPRDPFLSISLFMTALAVAGEAMATESWPQFRGPRGDGIVVDQSPPVEFGTDKNLAWRTDLPGRGWSSPVIADGVIWVTTAIERKPDEQERIELLRKTDNEEKAFKNLAIAKTIELKLLAVDLQSGSLLQTIDLAIIEQPDAIHSLNSYASPTPVIDGDYIYCHFGTFGTFAVDRGSHQILWQRVLPLQHAVGPGSSPYIEGERLVLIQDGVERQYVTALDKRSGETLWESDRPEMDAPSGDMKKSYCTPITVVDPNGRRQLICMGSQWLVSYDPTSGEEHWRLYHGKGFSVVPRPVYGDGVVYFATGFGKPQLWAARVEGSGDVTDSHVLWSVPKGIPAKPSPLLHEGLIYVVDDNGVASCLDAEAGTEVWKHRLGGNFSASPILAGGHLYFGNHEGAVFVIRPGREFSQVAMNQLDGQIMASPAVVNDTLIFRTAESLYRLQQSSL